MLAWKNTKKKRELGFQGCAERNSVSVLCIIYQNNTLHFETKEEYNVFVAITFFNLQGEKIIGHLFLAIFLWDLVSIKIFL